jgi:(2Fe-2S) ferredoxin
MKFRVLQSTHLGGCRFAATLLVLPMRQRYGRLEPRDVPEFLETLSRGAPFLPAYRGNPTLDPATQVAEHAALSFAALRGIAADVRLQEKAVPARATGEAMFMATVASLTLHIRLEQLRYEVNTRCSTIEGGTSGTADRWRLVSVEPLD